jgi:hypothetical protein
MVSPEAAAAIFPMEKNFFDLVIFDEASQCFVERAIPVMLRGTQCVIAGDDKQLRPADLYQVRYEEADTAFVENPLALEVESVLDLARAAYPAAHLTWHYRSRDAALIHFSNTCFYDGRLQMIPPARADHRWMPPIEWVSVTGRWESQANVPEAEAVVRLILELVASSPQPSLGVVTFNYVQQELIRDLLDQTLERLNRESPQLGQQLMAAMQRFDQEAFMGLFVKNIENVQGDERDVIIFSTGYAPDDKGRLSAQFGLLNQAGGENRLNVAVSRARQKIYIVCSFMPGDLRVADTLHPGPRLLQQYLAYGYAVSQGQRPAELMQSSPAPEPGVIAAWLAAALTQRGYQVVHALGDTRWRLDMAVRDPADPAQFKLGIECEGAFYFSGASVKEREVYRPALLRDRGWQVYRVWARNFWRNRDKELEQILRLLEA